MIVPKISPEKIAAIDGYMATSSALTELQLSYLAMSEGFVRKRKHEQMQRLVDEAIMGNLATLSHAILDLSEAPGQIIFIKHPSSEHVAPLQAVGYDTETRSYNVKVMQGTDQPIWPLRGAEQLSVRASFRPTEGK